MYAVALPPRVAAATLRDKGHNLFLATQLGLFGRRAAQHSMECQ